MTNKEVVDELRTLRLEIQEIKTTLDELTGAKKFIMWLAGLIVGSATVVATWIGVRHK